MAKKKKVAEDRFSAVIGKTESLPGRVGPRGYDREQIYRWMWDHSDSRGIITVSQREVGRRLDITHYKMNQIFQEFVATGHLVKRGNSFEVMYDPDILDWGSKFKEALLQLKKNDKPDDSGGTKE